MNHSIRAFHYLPYVPKVVQKFKNPIMFLAGCFKDQEIIIRTRTGLSLKTSNRDDVSSLSVIAIKHDYGPLSHDGPGQIIVDIGANKGYFSTFAATNKNNQVLAFEPITETYQKLTENISLNNLSNIKAFNLGVAGKTGTRNFSYSLDKSITSSMVFSEGDQSVQVECISLADVIRQNNLEKIDVLKVDCEGAEFEIFYNTPVEILAKIASVKMVYHDNVAADHENIADLTEYLSKVGFKRTFFRADSPQLGIAWFDRSTS